MWTGTFFQVPVPLQNLRWVTLRSLQMVLHVSSGIFSSRLQEESFWWELLYSGLDAELLSGLGIVNSVLLLDVSNHGLWKGVIRRDSDYQISERVIEVGNCTRCHRFSEIVWGFEGDSGKGILLLLWVSQKKLTLFLMDDQRDISHYGKPLGGLSHCIFPKSLSHWYS